MDNHENKPVQKLIDVYRDRWCYDSSYRLLERLLEEVSREQIEKMIEEQSEEQRILRAEAKLAAEEDEWWNAIK